MENQGTAVLEIELTLLGLPRQAFYTAQELAELFPQFAEGRVKPVTCHHKTMCMTHFEGGYHALDNECPHQGGPLGEGSIENGWLRCPWQGWDFHPCTGN